MTAAARPQEAMTAAARLGTCLSHREADRVPFILPATMHPARLLGLPLSEYLVRPEAVVEGQLLFRERTGHDALVAFLHAAGEVEPFGGQVVLHDDGPPNAGPAPLRGPADVERLAVPDPLSSPSLCRTLDVARGLAAAAKGEVLVVSGAVAPFSLPVAQLGFAGWLDLLRTAPALARHLLEVNAAFVSRWIRLQHEAGVALVVLFDPLASPQMVPLETWMDVGLPALRAAMAGAVGAVGLSTASAPCLRTLPAFLGAGAAVVAASGAESLAVHKAMCRGRATVVGNLDGIAMRRWTPADVEREVRLALAAGGPGGGFVLFEHHGEIPYPVPMEVLEGIGEAVRRLGRYPLGGGG